MDRVEPAGGGIGADTPKRHVTRQTRDTEAIILPLTGDGRFAICGARAKRHLPTRRVAAADVSVELRGAGSCSRQIHNFCTVGVFEADAPITTTDFATSAADDPMITFELAYQVRQTIQQTLYRLLAQRRNTFLG